MPLQAWGITKDSIWLLQVAALQKEIADIDKQVAEAEHMLRFADPGEPLHAMLCIFGYGSSPPACLLYQEHKDRDMASWYVKLMTKLGLARKACQGLCKRTASDAVAQRSKPWQGMVSIATPEAEEPSRAVLSQV